MLVGQTKIGETYRFEYPPEFTTLPKYSAHRGQLVIVTAHCDEEEADIIYEEGKPVDTMHRIQASDGWTGVAWDSELALP